MSNGNMITVIKILKTPSIYREYFGGVGFAWAAYKKILIFSIFNSCMIYN